MPRIALVTGANRGIGLAVARQLAQLGVTVVVGARDTAAGEAVAKELRDDGLDAVAVQLDTTDDGSVTRAAAAVAERFGRLDVLVNNAGIKLEVTPSPPSASSVEVVRRTFETNVLGTVRVTLAMLPLLRRSDAPRIVNVSSSMGSSTLATTLGTPYPDKPLLGYNVSKAALNSVTVQFANELRGTAFKVNAADPGYTSTDMTRTPGHRATDRGPDAAAAVIVRLATLPDDGPTGGFHDEDGVVPW